MAYEERRVAEMKWDKPGMSVEGRLVSVDRVKYTDGIGVRYAVQNSNGVMEFSGTTDINRKLNRGDIGCMIYVKFEGYDATREPQPGRSQPKRFLVKVDADSRDKSFVATDADIPF